jgi:oligopeptide transport system substrate-binding protein
VGVKVVDRRTLHFELVGPDPYFTALVVHHAFFPVHPPTILKFGTIGQRDTNWTRPGNLVSNGAFVLKTWRKNDVIEVVKSPTYWDEALVKLHGIHFYSIEDLNTEDRAFRAGQLHLTASVPLDKVPYYRREAPTLLRIAPYLGVYFYVLNVTEKPLDDPRIRLALSLAVDRESLVRNILRANQEAASGLIPPGISDYSVAHRIGYDSERARQLLAQAGYPDGHGFPVLRIFINTSEAHRTIAEAIQQMWKDELNINVRIENQEWKVYLETLSKKHFDIGRVGWIGDLFPESFLRIWKTESPNNFAGWNNPEYDNLLARVDRTGDLGQRVDLVHQAEDLLLRESPLIPIYWYSSLHLVHPSVAGWYPNVLDDHPYKFIDLEPLDDLKELKLSKNP